MDPNANTRLLPFNLDLLFRRRLGRTLLFCLLSLSIVPMAIVGAVGYQLIYDHLQQNIRQNIHMAAELKSRQLQTFFDQRAAQADGQAPEATTASFFSSIDQMLELPIELGGDSRVYLLDADRTLRAGETGGQHLEDDITINTAQTELWQKNRSDGISGLHPPIPFVYAAPEGHPVIGTHAEVRLGDAPYALIVERDTAVAFRPVNRFREIILTIFILTIAGVLVVAAALARRILGPVSQISQHLARVTKTRKNPNGPKTAGNEISELALSTEGMSHHIQTIERRYNAQSRFVSGLTRLHRLIGGEQELDNLCLNSLEFLATKLDLYQADFFIVNDDGQLEVTSRYPGSPEREKLPAIYSKGEQIDQSVREKAGTLFRKDAPSGLIAPVPKVDMANLLAIPLMLRQTAKGLLQLEKAKVFNRFESRFAEAAAEIISVALNAALIRQKEQALLERTRHQAHKLKVREAALEKNTRELQAQTRAFQHSEEKLQFKQLELEAANAQMVKNSGDLEAHMGILEKQKWDMQKQNAELEKTHQELAKKARQLETSSRYKTEFMANMSHELRTPLNSILLLSRLLFENKEKTLTGRQLEFARTVQSAGEDLLNLINEILDLAKVESGKMGVELAPVKVRTITNAMLVSFSPLAEQRGLAFSIHVDPDVPEKIVTDRTRIEQIVKNFLSNAFKFTAKGTVCLEIAVPREAGIGADDGGGRDGENLAISVVDTGIGIPAAKHQMVFEAFQQVDGSTQRKYGGTGLGLSISRELARMLGGKIKLESQDGHGSRFTLYLPIIPLEKIEPALIRREPPKNSAIRTPESHQTTGKKQTSTADPVPDDRNRLAPGEKCLLIIDADADTTKPIKAYSHRTGYKVLVAEQFLTGLHFADYYLPAVIFLNLNLPDGKGWEMIPRIKSNPKSRHIPVVTLSDQVDAFKAVSYGAADHIIEPITDNGLNTVFQHIADLESIDDRQILVVGPDKEHSQGLRNLIDGPRICTLSAATIEKAKAVLDTNTVHAVIVQPELDAAELHKILADLQHKPLPVFQCSGHLLNTTSLSEKGPDPTHMNRNTIDTLDQLLLTLSASLHLPTASMGKAHRDRLWAIDNRRNPLKGCNVLLADDDMRTVFAVSNVLEDQGATVLTGKTAKESLDKLNGFPDIDLVLMDVMISDVDGYQTIREIRNRDRYRALPIIALTAKAMQGDRAKCIQAGADDYLAKPVNLDKLTSMLKIWLEPQEPAPESPGS